jgi:hypothetical protein
MVAKTSEGKFKKELFIDGRISYEKEWERNMGIRPKTKTEIKRAEKTDKRIKETHTFS